MSRWAAALSTLLAASALGGSGGPASRAASDLDPAWTALSDCPGEPGCHAIVLLDETEWSNESNRSRYSYRRVLKVFTKEGVDRYGNIEVRSEVGGAEIRNLEGRTILPEGRRIDLDQKNVFVKYLRRGKRRIKVKGATFAGLVPGAIIEYSYDTILDPYSFVTEDRWDVQQEIPVLHSRYTLKQGPLTVGWRQAGMPGVKIEHVNPFKNVHRFSSERIPSLPREPHGGPVEALRARQHFFLPELQTRWLDEMVGRVAGNAGAFIDSPPGVAEKVKQLVAADDTPIVKVRKIYDFVQREIGTEDRRAGAEGEAAVKDAANAGDVLARGYGDEFERTLLFLALVKAAGMEHGFLMIASRLSGNLIRELPDETQFDSFAAAVKTGDSWTFYDPATRHCPFGMIAAEKEGGTFNAVLFTPQKGAGRPREGRIQILRTTVYDPWPFSLAAIPFSVAGKNVLLREATISLDAEGAADVEVSEQGTGQVDIERRGVFEGLDEQGRRTALLETVRAALPQAELVSASFADIDSFERPARIRYRLRVPAAASLAGDRLLITPSLFDAGRSNPFIEPARRTPVHFPYAHRSQETIRIELPAGYAPGDVPAPTVLRDPPFVFASSIASEEGRLVLTRRLDVEVAVSPVEQYPRLKAFFEKVQETDRVTIALSKGSGP